MYGSKPLTTIWLEAELFPTFGETLKIAQRRHVTLIHNNNMESKPQGDVIVVKTKEQEKKTKSGLFIPPSAEKSIAPPSKGLIIAVGNGSKERPMEYKEKQKIMFRPFSGYESEIEGEKYLLIKQGDVMMVLPDNEEVL
jgi:chaperonin GroES